MTLLLLDCGLWLISPTLEEIIKVKIIDVFWGGVEQRQNYEGLILV